MICVSDGWSVRRRTSSLEMRARQGIRSMRRACVREHASRDKNRIILRLLVLTHCEHVTDRHAAYVIAERDDK